MNKKNYEEILYNHIQDSIKTYINDWKKEDMNDMISLVKRIVTVNSDKYNDYVKELNINANSSKHDIEQSILKALSNGSHL